MRNSILDVTFAPWPTSIAHIGELGEPYVRVGDDEALVRAVAVEHVAAFGQPLAVGDIVVACQLAGAPEAVVIIGRLESAAADERLNGDEPPDTLVLQAKESLTLRVGDGSITIRADGKILIKGTDLVSHAKNVNRIKGGAVAIN